MKKNQEEEVVNGEVEIGGGGRWRRTRKRSVKKWRMEENKDEKRQWTQQRNKRGRGGEIWR